MNQQQSIEMTNRDSASAFIPPQDGGEPMSVTLSKYWRYIMLFFEQVLIMVQKHISQKQRKGRQFLKDTVMIQFFLLSFFAYILIQAAVITTYDDVYQKHSLPPLSDTTPWGIFNAGSNGNIEDNPVSKNLYYSPNTHAGVNALMDALMVKYPDVKATGYVDPNGVNDQYQKNLFDTWASVQFDLTADQVSVPLAPC